MPRANPTVQDVTRSAALLMKRNQWRRALELMDSVPRRKRTYELWWNHGWALGKLEDWKGAVRSFPLGRGAIRRSSSGHSSSPEAPETQETTQAADEQEGLTLPALQGRPWFPYRALGLAFGLGLALVLRRDRKILEAHHWHLAHFVG
jgi:hypothetical protein